MMLYVIFNDNDDTTMCCAIRMYGMVYGILSKIVFWSNVSLRWVSDINIIYLVVKNEQFTLRSYVGIIYVLYDYFKRLDHYGV